MKGSPPAQCPKDAVGAPASHECRIQLGTPESVLWPPADVEGRFEGRVKERTCRESFVEVCQEEVDRRVAEKVGGRVAGTVVCPTEPG